MNTCQILDCDKPRAARGWCWKHFGRWRRWGDPLKTFSQKPCAAGGCTRLSRAGGMCEMHYSRTKRNGSPEVLLVKPLPETCSVEGCTNPMRNGARGMCRPHYSRWYLGTENGAEKHGAKAEARRARLRSAPAVEPGLSWRSLYASGETQCHLCSGTCDPGDYTVTTDRRGFERRIPGNNYPSLDHVLPLSRGGRHSAGNVRLAHMQCNRIKHAKMPGLVNGHPA